jgi:epoxyqueuosine reductase
MSPAALRRIALAALEAEGLAWAGIARVEEFPYLAHFAPWIAQGRHGEMAYLAREHGAASEGHAAGRGQFLREEIRNAFPWARSVVCAALSYDAPGPRSTDPRAPGRGWIARYAWGDDYHEVLVAKLRAAAARLAPALREAGAEGARMYVDTGPLVERVVGYHAGLGWIGKNTCLIHPRRGSFFFLGAIILAAELEGDSPLPDRCGSCRRCIDACPTQALTPYQMDARRCIAYLNLELRGPIPAELRTGMGDNIIGCDICQDVCPWNQKAEQALAAVTPAAPAPNTVPEMAPELAPEIAPRPGRMAPELAALAALSEEDYRREFRGSAVKRAKYRGLRRNLAVAMGNHPGPGARAALERLAQDGDAMVREHAQWALERLARPEKAERLARPEETEPLERPEQMERLARPEETGCPGRLEQVDRLEQGEDAAGAAGRAAGQSSAAGPSAAAHPNAHRCALVAPGSPRAPRGWQQGAPQPSPPRPPQSAEEDCAY